MLARTPVQQGANPSPVAGTATTMPLARLSGAAVEFRGKKAIDGVSLAVHAGEIVTLIGPNGAGKTTLARALLGLVPLSAGWATRRQGLRTAYAPQRFPIDQSMPLSVGRFMTLNNRIPHASVIAALEEAGTPHLIGRQLGHLSGGEFQRVVMARALSRNPELLVLDEPAQALDFAGAAALYALIDTVRRERNCGILLISHDLHIVLGASDRVVCLNRHVCCEGVPAAVAGHPEYVRLFGPGASTLGLYRHTHDHGHTLCGDITP